MNKKILIAVIGALVLVGGGWFVFTQTNVQSQNRTTLEQGDETIGGGTGNAIVDKVIKQNTPAKDSDSHGDGTVTVNGAPYSFSVSSCILSSGGIPNMGGTGEAKIVLQGKSLLLNIPSLDAQYTVYSFTYEIDGQTLTGSGTGSNLAVAGAPKASIEMTATCDTF